MTATNAQSSEQPTELFQLRQQDLGYGSHTVLKKVTLSIQSGEKVALVGPSGSGKSTLLNHLFDLRAANIALCPQDSTMVDLLSAYHNLFMGGMDRFGTMASLWNLIRPLKSARQQLEILADELGFADQLWKSVDRLSGGQRQRVAIGRALFRQQAIFFGDEPVSSLDPHQAEQLLTLILQRHQTAVVAIHNPELALKLFDRVLALRNGEILIDQPTSQLELAELKSLYQNDLSEPAGSNKSDYKLEVNSGPAACVTGKAVR